jgi:hypothetical protein
MSKPYLRETIERLTQYSVSVTTNSIPKRWVEESVVQEVITLLKAQQKRVAELEAENKQLKEPDNKWFLLGPDNPPAFGKRVLLRASVVFNGRPIFVVGYRYHRDAWRDYWKTTAGQDVVEVTHWAFMPDTKEVIGGKQ